MAKTNRRTKKPASPRLPYDVKLALTAFTDFFVICTGGNSRQVQAIADGIQDALAQKGLKPALTEGYERAQWILIDYFDFIVHIFSPATREYYALERLWGDAKKIEIGAESRQAGKPASPGGGQ